MRSFTARDLIVLPRLNSTEAFVLTTELLTAADMQIKELKPKGLPAAIERSRARLATANAALDMATRPQRSVADKQVKRKADRKIDNAWSAAFDWASGWCKLPEEKNPHRADTLALFEIAFPGGSLGFTLLPYKIEWRESKARIDAILDAKHEKTFKRLGGEAFWAHILEAHKEYGVALGITEQQAIDPTAPDIRTLFLATLEALRDYATRVAAHAGPDESGSEVLSGALLRPLAAWESRPTGGETIGDGEDGDESDTSSTPGEVSKDG